MKLRRTYAAFTLIELLVVIAIIGIMAAVVGPTLLGFRKGDAMLSATRTLLDGVARARQLAISQHTTVFMVFVPKNFWDNFPVSPYDSQAAYNTLPVAEKSKATNVLEKQLTGFSFISMRTIGAQPGSITPRYLAEWQALPEKAFIAEWKFNRNLILPTTILDPSTGLPLFKVYPFNYTNTIPFPSEDAYYFYLNPIPPQRPQPAIFPWMPYIAFNYQGQLVSADGQPLGRDEYIPLAHGSVSPTFDSVTRRPINSNPSVQEQAPGNSTNSAFTLIHIDQLTGRARVEHQQVK